MWIGIPTSVFPLIIIKLKCLSRTSILLLIFTYEFYYNSNKLIIVVLIII